MQSRISRPYPADKIKLTRMPPNPLTPQAGEGEPFGAEAGAARHAKRVVGVAVEAPNIARSAVCRGFPLLERRIHSLQILAAPPNSATRTDLSALPQPSPSLFWGRVGE
ncbi:hypothetical protein FHS01_005786 [Longimicrobium terrae]|uniref:Uncharacterized protein n=1 Tax=Longimicrobium terrae TaxID=1639882 RepID=A0A841H728_9BACT|nr:hypothetical protein [Longimicrobium terrae]MBB6074105.1 hypothetical protein [Longimicrobium terrae]